MGYKIAQVGSFDVENYGDLLFSDVLEKQLKKRLSIEEMIYFAPKNCMMPNRNEKVYSVTELEKMVQDKKIDAIVVGGGLDPFCENSNLYAAHIGKLVGV